MPLGTEVTFSSGVFVFDGVLATPRKRAHPPHPILAHVYCGKTAGWIKVPLGTEVNVGPGDVVLDWGAALPKTGTAPSFRFMSIVAERLDE